MAELIFKFDNTSELEQWLALFKQYGLDTKLNLKKPRKKNSKQTPPVQPNQQRNWSYIGIGNLGGALDNIPNLRDYAYED